ncbi:MAG: flagellar basal body rod protein FlgB [Bdellovibrionota bacterium]
MTDSTTALLERVLDLRMKAHEVYTSNIANGNVPHYKARKIEFDRALAEAVTGSEDKGTLQARENALEAAVQDVNAVIYDDPNAPMKGDGNTVDMERQQTELAKNTIAYDTAIQLINKKFAMARYVLQEGGSR